MTSLTLHQSLPPYRVTAHNYATDAPNKIHSDEIASRFGFTGGLVPGVGDYAYLTRPVVETLGRPWLESGWMSVKLLKPVYDGETVGVRGEVSATAPATLSLELRNAEDELCAVAEAAVATSLAAPEPGAYRPCSLPDFDERPEATLQNLPVGKTLGSQSLELDLVATNAELTAQFRDSLPLYTGPHAVLHPAYHPHAANQLLHHNVKLGPWIHTASHVQHYGLVRDREKLNLLGRVKEAYEKRGHEVVVLDLALFGEGDRPIARIDHTAIIRPRQVRDLTAP